MFVQKFQWICTLTTKVTDDVWTLMRSFFKFEVILKHRDNVALNFCNRVRYTGNFGRITVQP